MVAITCNAKVIYCFVSDYILCIAWVSLHFTSLTFQANINLRLFRDEFVVKKRVFHERSAHSEAVLDDSLITVDTTSLNQRASKEVARVT